jgi:hypothetical protein
MQNATISQTVDAESVQCMAYEIWVKGGRRDGVAEQNWLEAERILNAAQASHSTHTAPSTPPESTPAATTIATPKTAAKSNGNVSSRRR